MSAGRTVINREEVRRDIGTPVGSRRRDIGTPVGSRTGITPWVAGRASHRGSRDVQEV